MVVHGGDDVEGGLFVNYVLLPGLVLGGGWRIGEVGPDHWGSPGLVVVMVR